MSCTVQPDGRSIICHQCGLQSFNPDDVANRYCGNCHIFHDEADPGIPATDQGDAER